MTPENHRLLAEQVANDLVSIDNSMIVAGPSTMPAQMINSGNFPYD